MDTKTKVWNLCGCKSKRAYLELKKILNDDPSIVNNIPFIFPENLNIVKLLLKLGYNVNEFHLSNIENLELMEFLLKSGNNKINEKYAYGTLLHKFWNKFDFEMLDLLLNFGADPYIKDNFDNYPFSDHESIAKENVLEECVFEDIKERIENIIKNY